MIFATGIGGIETLLNAYDVLKTKGPGRVSPFMVPMLMANAPAGHIAMTFGLTGANFATIVGVLVEQPRDLRGDAVAARRDARPVRRRRLGVRDAPAHGRGVLPDDRLDEEPRPRGRVPAVRRPARRLRALRGSLRAHHGDRGHAKARGARIYCEVAGAGASDDAFHITAPDPKGSGAVLAMRWALEDAGAEPSQVDYINAHGTSTPLNDASEAAAITQVLGDHAAHGGRLVHQVDDRTPDGRGRSRRRSGVRIRDHHGMIPPTIHYSTPDPGFELDVTPNTARELDVGLALSNSFGFGGHNTCVAFRKTA